MKRFCQMHFKKQQIAGLLLSLLVVGGIFLYYIYMKIYPSTENAYIKANLIYISPKIGGYVEYVGVKNNQLVRKGQLLIQISLKDLSLFVLQAQQEWLAANKEKMLTSDQINQAKSDVARTKSANDFSQQMKKRYASLFKENAGSLQNMQKFTNEALQASKAYDTALIALKQAMTRYEIANTRINIAKLSIKNAQLNKSYTKLYAPTDGYVSNLNLMPGQLVAAGQKLFALVDNRVWWVDTNLKENQISRIKAGQKASVYLDMYGRTYSGIVQSISYASGSTFSIFPPENASGNWIKIPQYFTVRVTLKDDKQYPLRVGASATVTVNTLSS